MLKFLIVIFTFSLTLQQSFACDYCLMSQGASPLQTNGSAIRLDFRYLDLNTLYTNGVKTQNTDNSREIFFTTQFSAILPLFDENTSVLISVPLSSRGGFSSGVIAPMGMETEPNISSFGVGDLTAMLRYRFWHYMDDEWSFNTAASIGAKTPTGYTQAKDPEGSYLDQHLQNGTGSLDAVAGTNIFAGSGLWGMSLNLFGWFPNKGVRGYKFGNVYSYEYNVMYHLFSESMKSPNLFLGGGVGGEWHAKEWNPSLDAGAGYDGNTGGSTYYFSPIVRLMFNSLSIELSGQIPVYHNLNGVQLGDTYRIMTGFQYKL